MSGKIWVVCIHGGYDPGDVASYAIAEDGKVVANHLSSNLSYAKHDMIDSHWKDEKYQAHYPAGYEVIWVGMQDPTTYPGLPAALEANKRLKEAAERAS